MYESLPVTEMENLDPEKALDALISNLDHPDSGTDVEGRYYCSDDSDDDIPLVDVVPVFELPDSPSPKRQRLKASHCKFCPVECSRVNLEDHLILEEKCKSRYFEDLKVSKIESVLLLLFGCLFCNEGVARLTPHFKSSPQCFENYCRKFNADSVKEVIRKINNLKREGIKSRRPRERKAENEKYMDSKKKSVTVVQAVNTHKLETSWSNYRKCVMCEGNFTVSTSREISFSNDQDQQFCLRSRPEFTRFQKFFVCFDCESNVEPEEKDSDSKLIELKGHRIGQTLCYQPKMNPEESYQDDTDENNPEIITKVTVMFPVSLLCVRDEFKMRNASKRKVDKEFSKCSTISERLLSESYTTQYSKYEAVLNFSKRFTGTITNQQDKVIGDVTQITDDARIRGSAKWKERKLTNMKERINQTGNSFFNLKVKIDKLDEESKATALVISGRTVTCSYEGRDGMNLNRQYFVHPDHNCDSPCGDNCTIIPLHQYLEDYANHYDLESNRWSSVFISSCHQKLSSLIRNILGCINFQMFSEEMVFSLNFDQEGCAIIQGDFWTKVSETFNKELSDTSFTGVKDRNIRIKFLQHVDSSLTCTVNKEELKEKFNLSEDLATKVSALAMRFQTSLPTENTFEQMPSLATLFKEVPKLESMHNIFESRELVKLLRENLANKNEEEICETSTSDWLEDLSNFHVRLDFNQQRTVLEVEVDDRVFSFVMEPRLSKLIVQYQDDPFSGIYHYSLTCVNYEEENSIVLKRLALTDCLTKPYNPELLLAMEAETVVTPVSGFREWERKHATQSAEIEENHTGKKIR